MASKDKKKEEILRSEDMKEVLDWFKAHPGKENNDVFDHFSELATKREIETHIRAFGYYDPENRYDPCSRAAMKNNRQNKE